MATVPEPDGDVAAADDKLLDAIERSSRLGICAEPAGAAGLAGILQTVACGNRFLARPPPRS